MTESYIEIYHKDNLEVLKNMKLMKNLETKFTQLKKMLKKTLKS